MPAASALPCCSLQRRTSSPPSLSVKNEDLEIIHGRSNLERDDFGVQPIRADAAFYEHADRSCEPSPRYCCSSIVLATSRDPPAPDIKTLNFLIVGDGTYWNVR